MADITLTTRAGGGGSVTSRSGSSAGPAASATQTITHNLGKTPTFINIKVLGGNYGGGYTFPSFGRYDAGGQLSIFYTRSAGTPNGTSSSATDGITILIGTATTATGVIGNITSTTFDIVWTASASAATAQFIWEVY